MLTQPSRAGQLARSLSTDLGLVDRPSVASCGGAAAPLLRAARAPDIALQEMQQ